MKRYLKAAKGIIITAICITFLVCPGLYAAEETLPTPEEIIAKNIEALGGKKALKKIYNRKIVRNVKLVQMNIEIKDTIYKERPNKFYSLADRGTMGKTMEGTNGKIAWGMNPTIGAGLLEGDKLSNFLFLTLFDGVDGPDAHYKSMKTEGIEKINGKDCYKVVKTPEIGAERTVYYDKKNFLIVKTTSYDEIPQGKLKGEIYFEEYQKINDILFPYKKVTFINDQKISEAITEIIEQNIEIPEGIFEIPEEVKAVMNKNETEQHAQQ